jgi:hypothetical protein
MAKKRTPKKTVEKEPFETKGYTEPRVVPHYRAECCPNCGSYLTKLIGTIDNLQNRKCKRCLYSYRNPLPAKTL